MSFAGFAKKDFNIFEIDGLDDRMPALKSTISPKLQEIGDQLAPKISKLTGETMYVHVAKHMRRSVNPPEDTWVAWAPNKRGYKKLPHFQVGMWQSHLFIWFAVIYECPTKEEFARRALEELPSIQSQIPADFVWSTDHTQPEGHSHQDLSKKELKEMFDRLAKVKKAELLCGVHISRDDKLINDGQALLKKIETTFQTLLPLYKMSQSL